MTLKKIFSYAILIFFVTFYVAGCQSQENKIKLTFSTWGSDTELIIINSLIKDFEKFHPDIKVEIIHIPQNYFQKLHMLVAANLIPDVIFVNNINMPVYAAGNIFKDLNSDIKNSNKLKTADFFSESISTMTYKNKLLAIPRDVSNIVVYYNKDLFDKYKVDYPKTNWNKQEFLESAKNLTRYSAKEQKIETFGVSFETKPVYWLPFVWSNGGKLFDKDNKTFCLSQSSGCDIIQYYADLRNKYHVAPKSFESGSNTMAQLFIQQKVAMYISGRWNVPKFREDLAFNWDVAPMPVGKNGAINSIDGSGWSISSRTKYPKEAWQLIEFLASKNSSIKFAKTGLIVPANKSVAYSKYFLEKGLAPKNSVVFLNIIKNAIPTPKIERWNEVADFLNVSLEPVWEGKEPACESLEKVRNDINELLE